MIQVPQLKIPGCHSLELEICNDTFLVHYIFKYAVDWGWWSETDPKWPDGPTMKYWHSDWELQGFQIIQLEYAVDETWKTISWMDEKEFEGIYILAKAQAERDYEE